MRLSASKTFELGPNLLIKLQSVEIRSTRHGKKPLRGV